MRRGILLGMIMLLVLSSLGGCYNRVELDETVAVTGYGLDVDKGQKVISVQIASPSGKPEGGSNAEVETMVLTESASGYAQAARQITLHFPRTPVWSLSTSIILSEALARDDLRLMMDFVSRNRFIRPNMMMFLTLGTSPEEVMQVKTPPEEYSSLALVKMMQGQESQSGIYMPVSLREFRSKYVTPGVEPVIPQVQIVEMDGEKVLQLQGVAVFLGHNMVGSLTEKESYGLRLLVSEENRGGLITVNLSGDRESGPLGEMVTMEITRSRSRSTPRLNADGSVVISVDIEADGNLYEQTSSENLQTTANLVRLEDLTSQALKDDALACIHKAQLLKSDIFGWGAMISRQHPELWQQLEANWPSFFASLQVEVEAKYSIRRTYLIEEAMQIRN
ncbi:MAG: Ger(x)C family spore germination protein [Syntrophomonas sp.]|nr:Ger(x)C family spore germination protein [Syntrophomonas sp.]